MNHLLKFQMNGLIFKLFNKNYFGIGVNTDTFKAHGNLIYGIFTENTTRKENENSQSNRNEL